MDKMDIFDQHLARKIVAKSLTEHFSSEYHPITGTPGKRRKRQPLVLIFAGSTGTGKTFLAEKVILPHFQKKFTKDACQSYIDSEDFANTEKDTIKHRDKLRKEVLEKVRRHRHSLFLFDEISKLSPEVLNELSFYFVERDEFDGVVFYDSVFLFLTNAGGKTINDTIEHYRPMKKCGTRRQDLGAGDHFSFVEQLEKAIGDEAGGLQHVQLIKDKLYTNFVPFFPLERSHVQQCVEIEARKLNYRDVNAIADKHPSPKTLNTGQNLETYSASTTLTTNLFSSMAPPVPLHELPLSAYYVNNSVESTSDTQSTTVSSLAQIYSGSFAKIFRIAPKYTDNDESIVKVTPSLWPTRFRKYLKPYQNLIKSCENGSDSKSNFVVKLKRTWSINSDETNPLKFSILEPIRSYLFVEMECCTEGCLMDLIFQNINRQFQKDELAEIFSGIVQGVQFLHSIRFIHGNLEPSNIMLTKVPNHKTIGDPIFRAKIGGYSFGKRERPLVYRVEEKKGRSISKYFLSPEQYNDDWPEDKSDVYSVGVLYFLLTLLHRYDWPIFKTEEDGGRDMGSKNKSGFLSKLTQLLEDFEDERDFPACFNSTETHDNIVQVKSLIQQMTMESIESRPTIDEVSRMYNDVCGKLSEGQPLEIESKPIWGSPDDSVVTAGKTLLGQPLVNLSAIHLSERKLKGLGLVISWGVAKHNGHEFREARNATKFWTNFGLSVYTHSVDLIKDLQETISEFQSIIGSATPDVCVVTVVSHGLGDRDHLSFTNDDNSDSSWIASNFCDDKCPGLINKRRLFNFMSCKAEESSDEDSGSESSHELMNCHMEADNFRGILMCYHVHRQVGDLKHCASNDVKLMNTFKQLRNLSDLDDWILLSIKKKEVKESVHDDIDKNLMQTYFCPILFGPSGVQNLVTELLNKLVQDLEASMEKKIRKYDRDVETFLGKEWIHNTNEITAINSKMYEKAQTRFQEFVTRVLGKWKEGSSTTDDTVPVEIQTQIDKGFKLLRDKSKQNLRRLLEAKDRRHLKIAKETKYQLPLETLAANVEDEKAFKNGEARARAGARNYLHCNTDQAQIHKEITEHLESFISAVYDKTRTNLQHTLRLRLAAQLKKYGLQNFVDHHADCLYDKTVRAERLAALFHASPHEINQFMDSASRYTRNRSIYEYIVSKCDDDCERLLIAFEDTENSHIVKFIRERLKQQPQKSKPNLVTRAAMAAAGLVGAVGSFLGLGKQETNVNRHQSSSAAELLADNGDDNSSQAEPASLSSNSPSQNCSPETTQDDDHSWPEKISLESHTMSEISSHSD